MGHALSVGLPWTSHWPIEEASIFTHMRTQEKSFVPPTGFILFCLFASPVRVCLNFCGVYLLSLQHTTQMFISTAGFFYILLYSVLVSLSCPAFCLFSCFYLKHNPNIHALCGIRTRNPSKRSAADPRHRQHGHRDRHFNNYTCYYLKPFSSFVFPSLTIVCGQSACSRSFMHCTQQVCHSECLPIFRRSFIV
jgi:hypothetical protein